MFRTISKLGLACLSLYPLGAAPQTASSTEPGEAPHWGILPTDQALPTGSSIDPTVPPGVSQDGLLTAQTRETLPGLREEPPPDLKRLLRPRVEFFAEWEPESEGLAISSYDLSAKMPLYPIFGPPPPMIHVGYSFTRIAAPGALDLPENLHDFSLGLAWMRRINDRWMARFMLDGAFASDMDNTSSDAWQIRGGGFALFRPNERWSWAFGALATGRDDVPVIPAVGVLWQPSPQLKFNLMMPNPRVAYLLAESGRRQHWGYVGGGIAGGTWAYDRASGAGERLSYREFRLMLGWESMPPRPPGSFRTTGTRLHGEIGYVFGREFELERGGGELSADDALLLRTGISF